uniref:UPAR/Ly6 domain-containing protein n=1 Tax=Mola mola TaxID=94237 RepID=A0A3Q3XE82_MOLML
MHVLTLMLGIVLLPKVYTLKCYKCLPESSGSCKITVKDCSSLKYQCGALRIISFVGGSKFADLHMKTCLLADECVENSVNFGISRIHDQCKIYVTEPDKSTPNGRKCYHCQGEKCTATLNCEGNEDHCISKTVTEGGKKMVVKGCASKQICSKMINPQVRAAIGGEIRCCEGNYCNGASSMHAGFLLLVAPLVSLLVCS